ncbi:MAG: hypothetical protein II945_01685 [Bacteroidales bacterium]|nr:hypothetical protein [Bacteroidales bacterium]
MEYNINLVLTTCYDATVEADSAKEAIEKIIKDHDWEIFYDTDTAYTSVKITDEGGDEEKEVDGLWCKSGWDALEQLLEEDK